LANIFTGVITAWANVCPPGRSLIDAAEITYRRPAICPVEESVASATNFSASPNGRIRRFHS
jgi:hypothetical protein